jgi:hypothetical protein
VCRMSQVVLQRLPHEVGVDSPRPCTYAEAIDAQLHAERIPDAEGQRVLTEVPWPFLPARASVMLGGDQPAVVLEGSVAPYDEQHGCYLPHVERPTWGYARALTPPSTLHRLNS